MQTAGYNLAFFLALAGFGSQTLAATLDPVLLEQLSKEREAEMLVVLSAQAGTWAAQQLPFKEAKGQWVMDTLRSVAEATQPPVIKLLKERGAPWRSFWIVNMVWTKGGWDLLSDILQLPDVAKILANPKVPLQRPWVEEEASRTNAVEWGISKVGAPGVWALGITGQGVVVGGQDTGYSWSHPALKGKYRGWNGSAANHNYNWHDAIHTGGGICGADSPVPCDDDGHGTHTMGTMVGDDGAGNQIGMAPGAKWIGCRNMDQGVGTPATYAECFQWFVAPTDLSGQNPDPSKAPHVINNSWGCPPSEGCTDPTVLQAIVENVRNAGIVVVVSAGNSGSYCASVEDPPAIYDAAFTVGATNPSDNIASFSSRGPVTVDASGRLKPDISAPGVGVRSSLPGGGYGTYSGTSMAGPHVAGGVALLLSATPSLKGQVDTVEARLTQTASQAVTPTGQVCGGTPDNVFPNNTYGYGRLDILAAVGEADLGVSGVDSPDPVNVGATLTYTIQVSNQGPLTASSTVLTVTLGSGLNFFSSAPLCFQSGVTLTCPLGNIARGTTQQVVIQTSPSGAGTISTQFAVSSDTTEYTQTNNSLLLTTTVVAGLPDLVADLQLSPSPVLLGRNYQVTLTAQNLGSAVATGVSASVNLGVQVAYVSGPLTCNAGTGMVTCFLGSVNPGDQASRTLTLRSLAPGNHLLTLDVLSHETDANPADNHAETSADTRTLTPLSLAVEDGVGGNGFWEPGETVTVRPTWSNLSGLDAGDSGTITGFGGPSGATYMLVDGQATYGAIPAGGSAACTECYLAKVEENGNRPQLHWDVSLGEGLTWGTTANWTIHLGNSFADVFPAHWAYGFVERLFHSGITVGCGGAQYCPGAVVSRWQMALFLARALTGGAVPTQGVVPGLGPYDCVAGGASIFGDVQPTHPGCAGIHYVASQGIALGCGAGNFCPEQPTTRGQMAVFLTRALVGSAVPDSGLVPGKGSYQCGSGGTSVFSDVPPEDSRCPHIHYLAAQGIASGCGGSLFCSEQGTRRDQMAVFLTRTFSLESFSVAGSGP